jgi:hypothetical protein
VSANDSNYDTNNNGHNDTNNNCNYVQSDGGPYSSTNGLSNRTNRVAISCSVCVAHGSTIHLANGHTFCGSDSNAYRS